ncbi:MAG TPA: hypothetical protein VN702_23300 [Acetobacteraceae bacterium]|nr:hypothetical protein [Acetobacteraceae bacterium]
MVSVPSSGDRISRWTPTIFACALGNFLLAQLLMVAGISWPTAPETGGATLAAVHLLTIGWITLLMFGALFQFVPVLTGGTLRGQRFSLATLLLIEAGLAGMVAGFFLLGTPPAILLPIGGSAVIAGVLAGSANLATALTRKRRLPLSARFVVAGLILLLLTAILGLGFALAFTAPALAALLAPLMAGGIAYHILAGVGGWFTLTAIGVSYELLPMFMLAPHDRGAWGRSVFWTACAGLAVALVAGFAAPDQSGTIVAAIEQAGRVVFALAIVLYLIDVVRMYRGRRRRMIELHNRAATGAFASLGIALLIAVTACVLDELPRAAPPLLFVLIFGWLSGLGLSQLYKIIPFLAWLSRFGRRLGAGPVPRVQDLVNEKAAAWMFAAYFASVAVAAVAAFFDRSLLVRGAAGVMLVATLLLAREYWRAWQGYYAHRQATGNARHAPPSRPIKDAAKNPAQATHA